MKRKIILIVIAFVMILALTGCGSKKASVNRDTIKANNNSVVLYFSATGTTKKIAKKISEQIDSDIIEIVPKEKYESKDLDYNNDCRANREQKDSKARPEIKNKIDISKYNTIYLGYPIWWGTNPKIILTLLDSYDFTGKTIIPFCTSGGSDIADSVNELRSYNSKLNIRDGKRFSSDASDESIVKFINNNIPEKPKKVVKTMRILINGKGYNVNLENNETAQVFANMLPLKLNMKELNGNEKYADLDKSLPVNSSNPGKIKAGDLYLYGKNTIVIFYKSFDTTYSYTKIGHIGKLPDLGKDDVSVKFKKSE